MLLIVRNTKMYGGEGKMTRSCFGGGKCGIVKRLWNLPSNRPRFQSHFCHLTDVWLWANYLSHWASIFSSTKFRWIDEHLHRVVVKMEWRTSTKLCLMRHWQNNISYELENDTCHEKSISSEQEEVLFA